MKKVSVFILVCVAIVFSLSAQNSKADKVIEKAIKLVEHNDEKKAVDILEKAKQTYNDYAPLYIFLAEIYYNNKDFEKSAANYIKGIAIDKDYDLNAYYRLGIMQKNVKDYTSAKRNFQYYIDNATKPRYKSKVEDCKYNIACIDFIEIQMQNPKEFSPYNLGENINDKEYQYLPTLTLDNQLYFTQRTNDKEDFYFATKKDVYSSSFEWNKKQKMPYPLNTDANEGAASISPDGRYLYFAKCNTKDGFGSCDIYRSKRVGDTWGEPENLGSNVNSSSWDSQPSIASDGRTLFFVSNREGGFGKSDIWYSYLKDDNTWTKARNCGKVINTGGNEISPFIHPSNSTLYFASDSLIGMGGMDIFYSKIIDGKFQEPVNIGYPINTDKEESCLIVSANGRYAVYARENAPNKMDLYAFELEKSLQPTKVICMRGKVLYDDNKRGNESVLQVKNLRTNRLVTSTISDKENNTYNLALVEGEDYALSVTCNGYLFYSENFSLKELQSSEGKDYLDKDIELKAIKEGSSVILKNIFFATNSFELMEESNAELNTILMMLNTNPLMFIEISGYTDNVGKEYYNKTLSQNRANSVKAWLVSKGVAQNRIIAKGYGMQNPVADNSTEEGRKQNRRTEFKILKTK